jgi:uncharacterized YccA/Bax inhibitor family protein
MNGCPAVIGILPVLSPEILTVATSNPAFASDLFNQYNPAYGVSVSRPQSMTVQGTVGKTSLLLAILSACGIWAWNTTLHNGIQPGLVGIAGIGGFILALVTIFRPTLAPWTAPLYAAAQGVFLGVFSLMIESGMGDRLKGHHGIVFQAISLTVSVLCVMLFLYGTRIIRVTDKFRTGVIMATGALALFYLVAMVLSLFRVSIPFIYDASPIGIGFSLFVVGLASVNLLLDFDMIEQGARSGAPKYLEWYGAFGLLVTLIWLYLEVLRLLRKFADER